MTTIAGITLSPVTAYKEGSYDVAISGYVTNQITFNELRELFALCESTAIQTIPGRKPIPWDPTPDQVNTVYIDWTSGLKVRDGYYLLRSFNCFEDESTRGLHYYFDAGLVYLGSLSFMGPAIEAVDLAVEASDWGI